MFTVAQPPNSDDPAASEDDLEAQINRRQQAALRLPPLDCGCRDPESQDHLAARCRYRTVA